MTRRALIVKTTSMGDVIHALPAVADLAKAQPDLQIDWVVEKSFADIPRLSRYVNTVHEVEVRQWRKHVLSSQTWREVGRVRAALQSAHYERVVDLQGLLKSAVIGRWSQSFLLGYDKNSIKEPWASRFYDQTFPVSKSLSAVTRCRMLMGAAFDYDFKAYPLDFGLRTIEAFCDSSPYAVFLVNTSRETKLWPEDKWVALAKDCHKAGLSIRLLWGSEAEHERVQRIACSAGDFCQVLPRMSIKDCAAVLQKASFVVGVDTGLTHLAAATQRPTVGLFLDYPIELVGLTGGCVKSLGGVGANPAVSEVKSALTQLGLDLFQ